MKKKYVEPEIFFESFELNANVAGVCETIITEPITVPGVDGTVFTDEIGCTITNSSDDDTICYHNPSSPFSS